MYRENGKNPLVLLLRDDLSDAGFAIAQACHAAYEYGRANNAETNNYIYILRCPLKRLMQWDSILNFDNEPHVLFKEPDLNNEPTALCCSIHPNRVRSMKKY